MNETLTTDQINQAFASRLASVNKSKLDLAEAVRDCCRNLPLGTTLPVAGHNVRWINAYCVTWGGRNYLREGSHTKGVLLVDGRLVDEPRFEVEEPDSVEHGWPATWTGPEGGWYDVAAMNRYNRLCDEYEGDEVPMSKPTALPECSATELSDVAQALPAAMSAWCVRRFEELDVEARNLQAQAALLHQQNDAMRESL